MNGTLLIAVWRVLVVLVYDELLELVCRANKERGRLTIPGY